MLLNYFNELLGRNAQVEIVFIETVGVLELLSGHGSEKDVVIDLFEGADSALQGCAADSDSRLVAYQSLDKGKEVPADIRVALLVLSE